MEFKYANGSISAEQLVKQLALSGEIDDIISKAIEWAEVRKKADELGLEANLTELQAAADEIRNKRGLVSAAMTMAFLKGFGLSVEDLEAYCEFEILKKGVKDALAPEQKINDFFLTNRADFDRADIAIITVANEQLARELIMQVEEDEEDFGELARSHSLDEGTKADGGRLSAVPRSAYTPEVSAKIFSADPGDVLGPFEMGEQSLIILVNSVSKATLNDEIKAEVKEMIYQDWLAQFSRSGITVEG